MAETPQNVDIEAKSYPHADDRCRQDSTDADGFRDAIRQIARLTDALNLADTGLTIGEIVDAAIRHLSVGEGVAPAGPTNASTGGSTPPPTLPRGTFRHDDGAECLWGIPDQKWYQMHPLHPLTECERAHHHGLVEEVHVTEHQPTKAQCGHPRWRQGGDGHSRTWWECSACSHTQWFAPRWDRLRSPVTRPNPTAVPSATAHDTERHDA